MVRRADQHEAVLAKGDDRDLRAPRGVVDDAEIDAAAQDILEDLRRAAVFEVDVHLRVRLEEALQWICELVEADAVDGRDAHAAAHGRAEALQLLAQLAVARRDVLARLVEELPRGCRLHAPFRALDETPI